LLFLKIYILYLTLFNISAFAQFAMPEEHKSVLRTGSTFPLEATAEVSLPQEKRNTRCSLQLLFSVGLQWICCLTATLKLSVKSKAEREFERQTW